MKLIQNNRFKINGVEYQVRTVIFGEGKRHTIKFCTTDWDKPVIHYSMSADEFDRKVTFENYVGLV